MHITLCFLMLIPYVHGGGNILMVSADMHSHLISNLGIAKHLETYGYHIDFLIPEELVSAVNNFGLKNFSVILRPNDNFNAMLNEIHGPSPDDSSTSGILSILNKPFEIYQVYARIKR